MPPSLHACLFGNSPTVTFIHHTTRSAYTLLPICACTRPRPVHCQRVRSGTLEVNASLHLTPNPNLPLAPEFGTLEVRPSGQPACRPGRAHTDTDIASKDLRDSEAVSSEAVSYTPTPTARSRLRMKHPASRPAIKQPRISSRSLSPQRVLCVGPM
jgi:hypothetical protein